MSEEQTYNAIPDTLQDQMFRQLSQENPQLHAVMQFMKAQENESDDSKIDPNQLLSHNRKLIKALKKAKKEIDQLNQAISSLEENCQFFLEVNDELASAIGACSECWGEIDDCQECGGNGHPGSFVPDREAFEALIMPAIKNAPWLQKRKPNSGHTNGISNN